MRRGIWFGTRDYATYIPAPSISGYSAGAKGWASKSLYRNGGANVRRSRGSHREYLMTWQPTKKQADMLPVYDFAQGLHGDLIYWSDPFAEATNVFPKDWATPVLGAEGSDGVNVTGGPRPTSAPTSPNRYGVPTESAQVAGVTAAARRVLVLIPPNRDLVARAYGQSGVGTLQYQIQQKGAAAVAVPWTAITDLNAPATLRRFSGGAAGSYVEVYLGASSAAASATIVGLMGQIVLPGATPVWQQFFSGRGHSGCRFDDMPQESPYSAPLDLVGMSAALTEVGAWL